MKFKLLCLMLVIFALVLAGCEGPEGPQGPAGPPIATYTYFGNDADACGHCHGSKVEEWEMTHHPEAYADLVASGSENNLYCVQCHTVGFDAVVNYGDSTVTNPGPDLSGFDDYWPPETADDSVRFEALKNVQCESCHGPMGPTINDHAPILNFTTRIIDGEETSMCVKCHEQVEEWHESGHGMVLETSEFTTIDSFSVEWGGANCAPCHTGQGFMVDNDPDWAGATFETYELIGCQGCHDPHDGTNENQLRNLDTYTVLCDTIESRTFEGYGTAQLCVQCHHARRTSSNVWNQIANGYAHFGPHGSPQMDMFLGSGSYEIAGYTYNRDHDHNTLTEVINDTVAYEACVTCHMEMREHADPLGWKGGHDFTPTEATCANNCHVAPGLDYHGVRVDIDAKLVELENALGVAIDDLGDPTISTEAQRMAGYAYVFVSNDGSHGVHNPEYALSLLQNAIDFISAENAKTNGQTAQR